MSTVKASIAAFMLLLAAAGTPAHPGEPESPGQIVYDRALSFAPPVGTSGDRWSRCLRVTQERSPLALSPDGQTIATCGRTLGEIALWEIDTGRLVRTLPGHPGFKGHTPYSLVFSPDGSQLASAAPYNDVFVWDIRTGEKHLVLPREIREGPRPYDHAAPVAFSADGKAIAVGLLDQNVRAFDAESGQPIRTLETPHIPSGAVHTFMIAALRFTPNREELVAVGQHEQILRWNLKSGDVNVVSRGSEGKGLEAFTISDDASLIAAAHMHFVRIRDSSTGKVIRRINRKGCQDCALSNAAFTPKGTSVAIAAEEDWPIIELYDITSGKRLQTFRGSVAVPHEVRISHDGKRIAAASFYHINVWRQPPGAN